ncbi:ABC transporter permease [Paenibacillus sp. N1-5-1-14]|uniref:ABC transporter permease n=1 Tax=Paenibacillus radicibacter TaxID=2972488 RepID=UPI002158C08C|nr:ABC transporter permease [Paenibacillus radicibacter]MCR8643309.1 ABC transporter permease [Paenibacillus radicibacter]
MNLSLWDQLTKQFANRWEELLQATGMHIELVVLSMLLAIVVGVPLGIWVSRAPKLQPWIIGGAGILQTIPSLALLGFMIPIFGIGMNTAIAALFLYSILPIVRNTYTGIRDVDAATIEAARGMGLTSLQILFKVQLPLALSVIMAGIRTSTVINVGTATLAAFIGAGGLGDFIFLGLSRNLDALILMGAVPAAMLALILDYFLGITEKLATPKGLK